MDVPTGKKRKKRNKSPSRKQELQGQRYEQEGKNARECVGGLNHRLFDTKDYQDRVGIGIFMAVEAWEELVWDLTGAYPMLRNSLRQSVEYVRLCDERARFKYVCNLMAQKQPADDIWIYDGVVRWIETKSTVNPLGLPLRNLKESQLLSGLDIISNGGLHYYWIVGCPPRKDKWSYWVWTSDMYELWNTYRSSRNIPWCAIEKVGLRIPYLKGKKATDAGCKWDFRVVLKNSRQSQLDSRSQSDSQSQSNPQKL